MAVVEVHPEPIDGPWIEGFVLDRHVISSRPIGYVGEHMQFETTRSALGELVYQLKYRNGPLTAWKPPLPSSQSDGMASSTASFHRRHRCTGPSSRRC